jgi:hypothetical protein
LAAELKSRGFRIVGRSITSDECPGVSWKPLMKSGRIDRAGTLGKVENQRRREIARQALASFA